MLRRAAHAPHTAANDPLMLLASAIGSAIEEWPIERLSHYQARWAWPPTFKSSPEWPAFVEDIRAAGIREPLIVLSDGEVVDGGHRLAAARAVGLKSIPVRVLAIEVPLGDSDRFALENWAVMTTLARRQLGRHEMRALIIDLEHAMAEARNSGVAVPGSRCRRVAMLAELLGMSAAHTKQVLAIAHRGSHELRSRVQAGTLSVDAAYRILTGKIGELSSTTDGIPDWRLEIDRLTAEATALVSLTLDVALSSGARDRIRREAARALETAADEIAQLHRAVQEWLDTTAC